MRQHVAREVGGAGEGVGGLAGCAEVGGAAGSSGCEVGGACAEGAARFVCFD